jgi:ABC-2 type transport system permease protein
MKMHTTAAENVTLAPPRAGLSEAQALANNLPSEDREAQTMWRLRKHVAGTHLWQLLTTARLRTSLVVGLSLFFWVGLFLSFYEGFLFIVELVDAPGAKYHADTFSFVFHLFFASLNVMLVFSSGIILFAGLYHAPETRFLLTLPMRPERIVLYKYQEALFYSSWGFFLLASPIMIAYGIVTHASWFYFAQLLPLIVAFVYIPCSVGAILCLFIIYKLPDLRRVIVGAAAVAVIAITFPAIWQTLESPKSGLFDSTWFQETLQRFRFTQLEWLPSSWLTNSLLEAARPSANTVASNYVADLPVFQSFMYFLLLVSNALMLHVLVVWAAKRWFRTSYANFACQPPRLRPAGMAWADRAMSWLLAWFPSPVRQLLLKDWRLLRRDPAQWSQFLIFFGLLGLYLLNMDRFQNPAGELGADVWINMVSFLNLAVVGLILSTFTTRFIYPMISLEGRCFWILGLLPIERSTILWSKFWFASLGSWVPCAALVLLSDVLLNVSPMVIWVHQLTCVLFCLGLASIAVGLGATMPNFRETSPSKIAAGFGGTLNLVLSAMYIIAIVGLTALPCHFFLLARRDSWGGEFLSLESIRTWLILGTCAATLTGAVATVVPLRKGLRAFGRMEFA